MKRELKQILIWTAAAATCIAPVHAIRQQSLISPTKPTAGTPHWKQSQILVTFWCPPPETDSDLARTASEQFTMTWTSEKGLDTAAKKGLKVMLHEASLLQPWCLDDTTKKRQLAAMIERVKKNPALDAYFLRDEPSAQEFGQWAKLVTYLREKDPTRLAFINLHPTMFNGEFNRRVYAYQLEHNPASLTAFVRDNEAQAKYLRAIPKYLSFMRNFDACTEPYRTYLQQFIRTVKPQILSFDHYPLLKDSDDPQYFLNLELVREAAISAQIPFVNIIQASRFLDTWRMPNAQEMRWMVYTSLAYGARGIIYFMYWGPQAQHGLYQDGKPTSLMPAVKQLNAEIAVLSGPLMQCKSVGIYHTAPLPWGTKAIPRDLLVQVVSKGEFVVGVFEGPKRMKEFMIVNRNYQKSSTAVLNVKGKLLREYDRALKHWSSARSISQAQPVEVSLQPGDGRLFSAE